MCTIRSQTLIALLPVQPPGTVLQLVFHPRTDWPVVICSSKGHFNTLDYIT